MPAGWHPPKVVTFGPREHRLFWMQLSKKYPRLKELALVDGYAGVGGAEVERTFGVYKRNMVDTRFSASEDTTREWVILSRNGCLEERLQGHLL